MTRAWRFVILIQLFTRIHQAQALPSVMLQDFEQTSLAPTVWVVNLPNENASVTLSEAESHDGKRSLKLHYAFLATGEFQYLGLPQKVNIQTPVRRLHFWLKGDNFKCGCGLRVTDADGETHQYSPNAGQGGVIDFSGWKEMVFDLQAPHETWGGDKNGQIDYPITAVTICISQPKESEKLAAAKGDLFFDSFSAETGGTTNVEKPSLISVSAPEYGSEVNGDTTVQCAAPGFKTLTVKCWKQGPGAGMDSTVAAVALDASGNGSFIFPANDYPHGPLTLRISSQNEDTHDNCYLQLYNQGGVVWNEGIPAQSPPAAQGMTLVFADDFTAPLSISSTNSKATYYDHKPPDGSQDFSTLRFTGFEQPNNPFRQMGNYLRIRASESAKSSGLISSLKPDASGITAQAPCYFECRLLGPNAIGTWPAFWLMTDYLSGHAKEAHVPCDELDIIEAYGGEGPHEPNASDSYMVTPHCWEQGETGKALEKDAFEKLHNPIHMRKFGVPATWYETFHVYGCKITRTDTIYYCDDIEVGRHPTPPLSRQSRFFFMINLATGGGWPVDLSRYGGVADMYLDYVRVYQRKD